MKFLPLNYRILILCVIGSILFNMAIFSAPYFLYKGHENIASFHYLIFSPICHQLESRSFLLLGYPLAVCARCTGIYAGFLAGLLYLSLSWNRRSRQIPNRKYFFIFLMPVVLDFALNISGILASPHIFRAFTGFLLGVVLSFFIMPGIFEMASQQSLKTDLSQEDKIMH